MHSPADRAALICPVCALLFFASSAGAQITGSIAGTVLRFAGRRPSRRIRESDLRSASRRPAPVRDERRRPVSLSRPRSRRVHADRGARRVRDLRGGGTPRARRRRDRAARHHRPGPGHRNGHRDRAGSGDRYAQVRRFHELLERLSREHAATALQLLRLHQGGAGHVRHQPDERRQQPGVRLRIGSGREPVPDGRRGLHGAGLRRSLAVARHRRDRGDRGRVARRIGGARQQSLGPCSTW